MIRVIPFEICILPPSVRIQDTLFGRAKKLGILCPYLHFVYLKMTFKFARLMVVTLCIFTDNDYLFDCRKQCLVNLVYI